MKLAGIEECQVTISLDVDECDLLAEGLRRAGQEAQPDEGGRASFWRALAMALHAASLPARMAGDLPENVQPGRYMGTLRQRAARMAGEEPPAA